MRISLVLEKRLPSTAVILLMICLVINNQLLSSFSTVWMSHITEGAPVCRRGHLRSA